MLYIAIALILLTVIFAWYVLKTNESFIVDQVGDYIRIRGGYPVIDVQQEQKYVYSSGPIRSVRNAMKTCSNMGGNVLIYTDYFAFEWCLGKIKAFEYLTPEYMVKDPLFYTYVRKDYYSYLYKDYLRRKNMVTDDGEKVYIAPKKFSKKRFQDISPAFSYLQKRVFSPRMAIPDFYIKGYKIIFPTATKKDIELAWTSGVKVKRPVS